MKLRGRCANTIIFLTILTFNRKAKTIPRIGITRSEVEILRGVDEGNLRRRFEMMMMNESSIFATGRRRRRKSWGMEFFNFFFEYFCLDLRCNVCHWLLLVCWHFSFTKLDYWKYIISFMWNGMEGRLREIFFCFVQDKILRFIQK